MKASFLKMAGSFFLAFTLFLSSVLPATAASTITPGTVWLDTTGGSVQAHGGGITKVGSTYYWYGEDHLNGYYFQHIVVYSSTDLKNWKWAGYALSQASSGDLGPNRVVERPKVIYNASTGKYVMYLHIDDSNYAEAKVGVATSSTPAGPFTYQGSWRPNGHQSRDMTIFQDTNGSAYLVSLGEDTSGNINQTDRIFPLSSDYLTAQPEVYTFANAGREGLAVFKAGSYYFIVSSACTGWAPNQQKYTYSTSMTSGWNTTWTNLGDSTGYQSQTNYIQPIQGSSTTSYVYMGDRWNSSNLSDSRYVWLPLTVSSHTLTLNWYDSWDINTTTGVITATSPYPNASYTLINRNSGKVLEVSGSSTANGGNVDQGTSNGGANQKWKIIAVGAGKFKLINVNSSKALDVNGQSLVDGANVDQWTDDGGTNQQWTITAVGSYYKLTNVNSGKVLDVSGASSADGANVDQWTDNGGTNQQWTIQ